MPCVYVTYLTVYKGGLLPPFYIGSSREDKISAGYHGSVSSKAYRSIWKKELKVNPHLFKTHIISRHETVQEARQKELKLQTALKVVKSSMYINQSLAQVNGFFGNNTNGELNPMYGKQRLDSKERMSKSNPMHNKEVSSKVTAKKTELRLSGRHKSTANRPETINKTAERMQESNPSATKCSCIVCQIVTTPSGLTRYHKHGD